MQTEIPPQFLVEIRKSANQPLLWFGCEPTPFILLVMASACILYSLAGSGLMESIVITAVFFFVCFKILQMYGEKDPMYIAVYLRNLKYKRGFWTAKPSDYK